MADYLNSTVTKDTRRPGAILLVMVLAAGLAVGGLLMWAVTRSGGGSTEAVEEHANELPAGVVELTAEAQKNAAVQVVAVQSGTLPTRLQVTGTVRPDEARVAHIRPLGRGVVKSISARIGDRVRAGQALVTIDNVELGELIGGYLSERAALRQAESDVDVKRRALERATELIKLEAIAQQTLDLRQAEFRSAEAAVSSQRARVANVEERIHRFGVTDAVLGEIAEEGAGAHGDHSQNVLRAPFEGIVTAFDASLGELVDPERELFTIANITTVWVLADVYEKDIDRIRRDTDVAVQVETFPGRTFSGRLTYISDLIDPQTRTAKVRCVVQNPDGSLKLDMFARVSIPTVETKEAVMVPVAAVQQIGGDQVVFVQQAPSRFERRPVQLGPTAGEVVEVLSGVKAGERIVSAGSFYLKTALLRETIGDEH